jgi:hypothetical protein
MVLRFCILKMQQHTRVWSYVTLIHILLNHFKCTELINYTQPVYVWREDPNSRQNTIKEIIDRATSDQDWPQVSGNYFEM